MYKKNFYCQDCDKQVSDYRTKHCSQCHDKKYNNYWLGKYHSEETKKILSLKLKGRKITKEWRKKISQTRIKLKLAKGSNNPNWKGGKKKLGYTWKFRAELKYQILKRDNFTCSKCNQYGNKNTNILTVHHINYNRDNNQKKNLICLCKKCNSKVNFNRDYWYAYFKYLMEINE